MLRAAHALCEEVGDTGMGCSVAANLAHALIRQHRSSLEEALRYTELSERTAVDGDVHAQLFWRTARALIVAPEDAQLGERLAAEAIQITDGTDNVVWRAHAYESLGEVLSMTEQRERALDPLRAAHQLYVSKGHRVKAEELAAKIELFERSGAERRPPDSVG